MTGDASLIGESPRDAATADDALAAVVLEPIRTHWRQRVAVAANRFEDVLMRVSDWFNPILVKETRQALKSWQFALTFVLVLVACWICTIGGIAFIGPSIYYAAGGGSMLMAYYFILAFPLIVVVPFAAFRSLAAEQEDNTYDLLKITTLRSRQIVSGKLGSAVVQMAVYFSAITPCLAFTYLLRGVDVPTIALLLAYTFFASLGLSMLGVLLATLSQQRYTQVILSVAFIALLLVSLYCAFLLAIQLISFSYASFGEESIWIAHLALATFSVTTFALAYFAAASIITFSTENRSTPLRIVMLFQQACWIGWMGYAWLASGYEALVIVLGAMFAGIYWYLAGTMLTGERPEMPRRVKRGLPQTYFGRMFLTWLNPGPYSGYMFVVANLTVIAILGLAANMSYALGVTPGRSTGIAEAFNFLVVGWGYVVAYLGLGCLIVSLLRRVAEVTMLAGVLIHFLLVLAGSGIPAIIQWMSVDLRGLDYSYLQITSPIWTLTHLLQASQPPEATVLLVVIPAAAICVLLLNLPGAVRELRQVRMALPERVVADEAELHPAPAELPSNPWEAEE